MKNILSSVSKILTGFFAFAFVFIGVNAAQAGTTPAISSATMESTGTVKTLLLEFNVPVFTDAALTTALATTDFSYTDTNAAGAASITSITHTAGDDFAVIELNADTVAGDTADIIRAVDNQIFTVGGALPGVNVTLTDDAGTAPTISSVTFFAGTPRLLVTFSKRVFTNDVGGAGEVPTGAPAYADIVGVNTSGDGCSPNTMGTNLLAIAGARKMVIDCGENSAGTDTTDTLAAASATSLFDAFGNDMGTATTAFTADAGAPTIISVEAVKDGTAALLRFSEPVFTDNPATGTNPAVFASADLTYTDGATGGTASLTSATPGASSRFMLIGSSSGGHYATMVLNAAAATNDLLGGASDDTLDATGNTAIFDALGQALLTGVAVAQRTLNDTIDPVVLTITFNVSGATGQNTVAILYSEDVTVTGAGAAGAAAVASTTTMGDMTTACTAAGFGAFGIASGNLTYRTLLNSVALNAAGDTFTITMAGQAGGYRTSSGVQTSCSAAATNVFTPTATVVDLAPTVNTIETTSTVRASHTVTTTWDVAHFYTILQVPTHSSATTNTETIGWTALTEGDNTGFREYKFFYGSSPGAGAIANINTASQWGVAADAALTTRTTTSTTITGLSAGAIVYMTPYVIDTFGNPLAGPEINAQLNSTAGASDRTAPSAPTGLTATSKDGKAVLTWTDPTATDLKDIVVLRGKNELPLSGTAYSIVNKALKTYTDPDTAAGDVVKYILRARDNSNNESANSTEVSVTVTAAAAATTTPATPATPPPPPPAPATTEQKKEEAKVEATGKSKAEIKAQISDQKKKDAAELKGLKDQFDKDIAAQKKSKKGSKERAKDVKALKVAYKKAVKVAKTSQKAVLKTLNDALKTAQ